MHGPRDCYTEGSKGSKSDTERQVSCDIAYVWNRKKKTTNELIYKIETVLQM